MSAAKYLTTDIIRREIKNPLLEHAEDFI